jgi:hypothetical protein
MDLGRTRVGVLGGIEISLIGDFRSIELLHNEIVICDFLIKFGPSIMRDVCQEIRSGNRDIFRRKSALLSTSTWGNPSENPEPYMSHQTVGTRGRGSQRVRVRHIGVFEYIELLPSGIAICDLSIGSESSI